MHVGYLPNAFDLLNVRDLDLIAQARQHCSRLVVGVFTDDYAARRGRRPVVPLAERMALVAHVRGVDEVVVHDQERADVGVDTTVFGVIGETAVPSLAHQHLLVPLRETTSPLLREALHAAPRERVG